MTIISIFLSFFFMAQSLSAQEPFRHLGVLLPVGCEMIEKNRFRSSKNYPETVKEMKLRLAKNFKAMDEINLPNVRTLSLRNTNRSATLTALNIYLNMKSGITEIFFVEK